MRIAIVSTCALATPPRAYGGTEFVMAELAKGLSQRGHDVTVYATADSEPEGELRYLFPHAVWPPNLLAESRHAAHAFRDIMAERSFDVIHVNHQNALPFTLFQSCPTVMTLHLARDEDLVEHYRSFGDVSFVAISHRQAELLPDLDIAAIVHHGLDPALYPEGSGSGGYAAFLGRLSPQKAPHVAIEAARLAGVPLLVGGAPHPDARDYFVDRLTPELFAPGTPAKVLGELDHPAKLALLRDAQSLLFPLAWEEPFGLVMIESMLVGTPVIAYARGSAPEIIEHGVTGFLVESPEEMAVRMRDARALDRKRLRARAQERWSHLRMTRDYEHVYVEAIARRTRATGRHRTVGARRAQDGLGR
jgi:glycosyltransferase involved in cell wall biosynthesis